MPDEAKSSDLSQIRKVSPSLDARKDVLSVKFEPKPRIVVSTINVSPVFERKKQELPDAAKQTLEDTIIPDLSDKGLIRQFILKALSGFQHALSSPDNSA